MNDNVQVDARKGVGTVLGPLARKKTDSLAGSEGLFGPALKRLARDKLALLGLGIILTFFAIGIFAPYLVPNDPEKVMLAQKLAPPGADYSLGTDHLGRCILSRLIYGTRVSLSTALLVLTAIMFISVPVGTVSGYAGGRLDNIIMRIIDILLAFPSLILALVIAGMLGPSLINMMIALAAVWWVGYARVIRGVVLSVKEGVCSRCQVLRDFPFWHYYPPYYPQCVISGYCSGNS